MARGQGHTLVELLTVLAVVAILLGIGVPSYRHLREGTTLSARVSLYAQALHTARHIAVLRGRGVTLCALDANGRCSGDWSRDLTLFFEDRRAGILERPTDIIAVIGMPPGDQTQVRWRGFGEDRFLHVWPSGGYWQNGRFTFCPQPANPGTRGRSVVVNVLGRARFEDITCT